MYRYISFPIKRLTADFALLLTYTDWISPGKLSRINTSTPGPSGELVTHFLCNYLYVSFLESR